MLCNFQDFYDALNELGNILKLQRALLLCISQGSPVKKKIWIYYQITIRQTEAEVNKGMIYLF